MRASSLEELASSLLHRHGSEARSFFFDRSEGGGRVMGTYLRQRGSLPKANLIFLHGTGNDHLHPQVSFFGKLLEEGCGIFSWDLDGHGRHSTTLLNPSNILSSIKDGIRQAQTLGLQGPFHLMGYSLGGALALAYGAHEDPSLPPLASITAMATPLDVGVLTPAVAVSEVYSLTRPSLYKQLDTYGISHILATLGGIVDRRLFPIRTCKEELNGEVRRDLSYVKVVKDILRTLALEENVHQIKAPVHLIYAGADRIAPVAHGQRLLRHLPSKARLTVLSRETHVTSLFYEKLSTLVRDLPSPLKG